MADGVRAPSPRDRRCDDLFAFRWYGKTRTDHRPLFLYSHPPYLCSKGLSLVLLEMLILQEESTKELVITRSKINIKIPFMNQGNN